MCVFRKNGTVVSLNRGQWFHQFRDSLVLSIFACLVEVMSD